MLSNNPILVMSSSLQITAAHSYFNCCTVISIEGKYPLNRNAIYIIKELSGWEGYRSYKEYVMCVYFLQCRILYLFNDTTNC